MKPPTVLLFAIIIIIYLPKTNAPPPPPFQDELKANFNLNDQRISEVQNLLDQIQVAADKHYRDGGNRKTDKPDTSGSGSGGVSGNNDNKNTSNNGGGGGGAFAVPGIGVGHPNFSVSLAKFLFEGDILLTPIQANSILRKLLDENRNRRAVISNDLSRRWKVFPIRYDFDATISGADDRTTITNAVTFWADNTCLSFSYVPGVSDGDYVSFFAGQGCYSMIGQQGGKQSISLGDGCIQMGVITHEVGHSLGLWHEQSRPDADGYVTIIPENVLAGLLSNFLQRSWSDVLTYNIPYDLGSIMHYGGTAFSVDFKKLTIETVKPAFQRTIGQREHPSFYDVKMMNTAYCNKTCAVQLPCQYGGYPHPKHCERCLCPDGLGGTYCEKPADPVNADCGGIISVNSHQWTNITSPGYPQPGFDVGQQCTWLIRSDPGTRIILLFIESFQFICSSTCLDYVEVKNDTDFGNTGIRFCCYKAPDFPVYSENNEMLVIFRATTAKDVGFKAQLQQYPPSPNQITTTANPVTSQSTRSTRTITHTTLGGIRSSTTTTIATTTTTATSPTTTTTITTVTPPTTAEPITTGPPSSWTAWSPWSECTRTCGACGVKARNRQCKEPPCIGEKQQYKRCAFDICPSNTICSQLQFSDTPCGKHKEKVCSDANQVTVKCSFPSCCDPFAPVDGYCRLVSWENTTFSSWGKWSDWGDCLGSSCGGCAIRVRIRACEDDSCIGSNTEYQRCNLNACTNCATNPGNWVIGDCNNGKKDQCIRPRSSSETACPCCPPLVLKSDGQCHQP